MDFIYLLFGSSEWEDTTIFLSEVDAVNASIKYPSLRVEIFRKNIDSSYTPTYNFYKNGQFIQRS